MATSLATALRQAIEEQSLTMAEAAAELGVTQPTVSRWLRGTPPDAARVSALAGFRGVDERRVDELVMQARRHQLERRRSELVDQGPPTTSSAAASDEDIELDFNSAMTHVPEHIRRAVLELVTPYLDEDERPAG